jgi:hypothetical protein
MEKCVTFGEMYSEMQATVKQHPKNQPKQMGTMEKYVTIEEKLPNMLAAVLEDPKKISIQPKQLQQQLVLNAIKQNTDKKYIRQLLNCLFRGCSQLVSPMAAFDGTFYHNHDENFMRFVLDIDVTFLAYASFPLQKKLGTDLELMRRAVRAGGYLFIYASLELKNDVKIVIEALKNGANFGWVAEPLKSNPEVVLVAVEQDWSQLRNASPEIKDDFATMSEAVKINPRVLELVSDRLKRDPEFVFLAVTKQGKMLQHADDTVKGNKGVVLAAVSQDGHALKFAASDLIGDIDVVLKAVQQTGDAKQHASSKLRKDKKVRGVANPNLSWRVKIREANLLEY